MYLVGLNVSIMDKKEIKLLLEKYDQGLCSEQELARLESWYMSWRVDEELDVEGSDADGAVHRIWSRLDAEVKVHSYPLWKRIASAAAVLLVLGGGLFYFYDAGYFGKKGATGAAVLADVAPGKSGATLTLAGGRRIGLDTVSSRELLRATGMEVSKGVDGELVYKASAAVSAGSGDHVLTTALGQQFSVVLPDGSKVWLNAGSSLSYPAVFAGQGKRMVSLSGEGYFEVAKDALRPFVVRTERQVVEVLGTHFNVNGYADEPLSRVTLLEGHVRVSSGSEKRVLAPGEQGISSAASLRVVKVSAENAVDWKDGLFVFDDEPLESVMRRVARWYNVEVEYAGADKGYLYGGSVSRFDHVSKILKRLEMAGGVHFKIEGRKIIAMK